MLVAALVSAAWSHAAELKFRVQEISDRLSIGYATRLIDMNDDAKPDIVVVDTERVVWFENPQWTMHTLIEGQTKKDNVSIALADIDGDGKLDFALAPIGDRRHPCQRQPAMALARGVGERRPGPCTRSAPSRRCIESALPISMATGATS